MKLEDSSWSDLEAALIGCRRCARLTAYRERVACDKRAAFKNEEYWGRPVPGFGDREAGLLIVGLAPAAHGANRTGRMFTGDRSGDWLYRALHRAGLANQAASTASDDGLRLSNAYVSAAVRCAPPDNRPTPRERDTCRPFLEREIDLLQGDGNRIRAIVTLGQFAYDQVLRILRERNWGVPRPKPRFGHGREVSLSMADGSPGPLLIASFHPSQQNTFTGKLSEEMLDAVFGRARSVLDP